MTEHDDNTFKSAKQFLNTFKGKFDRELIHILKMRSIPYIEGSRPPDGSVTVSFRGNPNCTRYEFEDGTALIETYTCLLYTSPSPRGS